MTPRFKDRIAIVTGAAAGIGKACMHRLAAEGATVLGVDRDADRLARAVAEGEGAMVALPCDVADAEAVGQMVDEAVARFGAIHVLVNNAGIGNRQRVRLHEQTPEDWDRVMAVNVRGLFLMQRAVIPHMLRQGGGSIVNMASIGSYRATALSSPYITSKGAALMMTRAAAVDYAKDNIRVNAVCPGTTNTDILAGSSQEVIDMLVARAPQGALVEPEEVAALVAFLASDEAPHITGGSYLIDAGRSAS
ncbi:3-oxoacyl-ACP reductase [Sphingobium jiangsuense]|uniref:NAD(P)-dependent dehydrogenase (Short-subunit alcohol dehydrogenase family) n=1 Tax=Sphingobium jiangsuense TaxID=870476 RepID=A0A7W6FQD0_9SPHN|nr:SDR family oxidoreductase [Sphingobium jiangsuense]MBB3925889.1 NAD(P)-dependent dehydrogenase (short-subunit alcohol dehydrogenase family) [Sphingobium jiangsuense]GLS98686.1 3-oxoacyl-ACP reductase [Sphingobium jiangsuense]